MSIGNAILFMALVLVWMLLPFTVETWLSLRRRVQRRRRVEREDKYGAMMAMTALSFMVGVNPSSSEAYLVWTKVDEKPMDRPAAAGDAEEVLLQFEAFMELAEQAREDAGFEDA